MIFTEKFSIKEKNKTQVKYIIMVTLDLLNAGSTP